MRSVGGAVTGRVVVADTIRTVERVEDQVWQEGRPPKLKGVVLVGEIDGGKMTPAECEARMRAARDQAMRVAFGLEPEKPVKPKEPIVEIKSPDDPIPEGPAEWYKAYEESLEAERKRMLRSVYGGFGPLPSGPGKRENGS